MQKSITKTARVGRHTPSTIRKHSKVKINMYRPKYTSEVPEQVPTPKPKKYDNVPSRYMINRACNVSPSKISSKNTTSSNKKPKVKDQYQNILIEQYGFDPVLPENINRLKELKKLLCDSAPRMDNSSQYSGHRVSDGSHGPRFSARAPKVKNSSQYANPTWSHNELSDISKWYNVDTLDDLEKYVSVKDLGGPFVFLKELKEVSVQEEKSPRNINISEIPRIKFIAEKFSRFRKNDLEVRKLNEKIVCVEYEVFDGNDVGDSAKPIQILRAFFSIKPPGPDKICYGEESAPLTEMPSFIKQKYEISDEDLQKLNEKEIEIIDEKMVENRSYLDDLKRILRRKQDANARTKKTTLDLHCLYRMAQMDIPHSDYDFSKFMSKDELDEVKDLILKRCVSSIHGISRRCMKSKKQINVSDKDDMVLSKSTILDLMRDKSVKILDSEENTQTRN